MCAFTQGLLLEAPTLRNTYELFDVLHHRIPAPSQLGQLRSGPFGHFLVLSKNTSSKPPRWEAHADVLHANQAPAPL